MSLSPAVMTAKCIFSKSPLCDNIRVRVTHSTFFVNSFSFWSLFSLCPISWEFLFLKKKTSLWELRCQDVTLLWKELIQNKHCCQASDHCDHLWLTAHDSADSLAAVHWLWHRPRPHWAAGPALMSHCTSLTHLSSVFYPCVTTLTIMYIVMCHSSHGHWRLYQSQCVPPWPASAGQFNDGWQLNRLLGWLKEN